MCQHPAGLRDPELAVFISECLLWGRFQVPGLGNILGETHQVHAVFLPVSVITGESVSAHLPSGYLNTFKFRTFTFICCS